MSIQALTYVLEHCEAQHGARCMMFSIANHCDERGENCWASVATMAHEARLSRRGAQEALAALREAGEIEAMGRSRGQTTVYRIVGMATDLDQVPLMGIREGCADSALPQNGERRKAQRGAQNHAKRGADPAHKPLGTVREPTPLTPQRGELPIPIRPVGGRRRENERYHAELDAAITELFGEVHGAKRLAARHALEAAAVRGRAQTLADAVLWLSDPASGFTATAELLEAAAA